ncbi:class II fumarate hydratase [Amphibacillus xylanus]|uniref:Fumarate hydratase class II n=1 Tax=Amphibacillus xylanus (strain ATCC 51415 / DSM 6626 / JCM 7361 / LMG 17667 / NBRC 15112 / Ep01) TaxID=698758 RepID=K0IZP3_AMPXN|nr:fumarate hydratase class II [Amphibacillus xylanus NBRC 15112]
MKRIETDTLGQVEVDQSKYWGAQTQRSLENFPIGIEKMPTQLIRAFVILKRSTAVANYRLKKISKLKKEAIVYACDHVLNHDLMEHFPLVVWQTGSGTQTNMNVNEVLAFIGNQFLIEQGHNERLHPNDDINKSQSSNDTFPTAMHIAAVLEIEAQLLPALDEINQTLIEQADKYRDLIKIGRTHLQDATPITFGQEISGWQHMIEKIIVMVKEDLNYLNELAIGGTAVGTGLNAHSKFSEYVVNEISQFTNRPFKSAANKFHALTSHDQMVRAHGTLKALAANVMKIANDIRWLASGPRAGIGELVLPTNEPGSSIMPGKVNPTQAEALTMVAVQVMGNDTTIGIAASQGNFELNVFKPVIIYNFLQSVQLLADGIRSFNRRCLVGMKPNETVMTEDLNASLMLVTALNPHIGYDKASEIAKKAYKENITLKQAALELGYLTETEFEQFVDPAKMVEPRD